MRAKIKEVLDELIQYKINRQPIKYLTQMFNDLGDMHIYSINGFLLQWHKEVFLEIAKPDRFEIDEVWFDQYTVFFEKCPELKEIFSLHKDYIGWAKELTKEEQDEIRNYIHENYKVQIRIRSNKNLNK